MRIRSNISDMLLAFVRTVTVFLLIFFLTACNGRQKSAEPQHEATVTVSDPTPPDPPDSVQVPADLKNMPAFLLLAIGGIASEGEKEGIEAQENVRVFRTDASAQDITSFYARELKARGWTTDNQTAQSGKVGLTMQEYRRAGTEALYLIISEPEDAQSSDATKAKRHVALLPAAVKKAK
jgi:hypothetical protein